MIYLTEGSEGEVLEFDNLKIVLPKKPRYKKDILILQPTLRNNKGGLEKTYHLKALTRENATDYVDYIEEEFRRRDGWVVVL